MSVEDEEDDDDEVDVEAGVVAGLSEVFLSEVFVSEDDLSEEDEVAAVAGDLLSERLSVR